MSDKKLKWSTAYMTTTGKLFCSFKAASDYLTDHSEEKYFHTSSGKDPKNLSNNCFIKKVNTIEEIIEENTKFDPIEEIKDKNIKLLTRVWAVRSYDGPWDLLDYKEKSKEEKIETALNKLTKEERKLLGW